MSTASQLWLGKREAEVVVVQYWWRHRANFYSTGGRRFDAGSRVESTVMMEDLEKQKPEDVGEGIVDS